MVKTLRDLKVGDTVFVVWQNRCSAKGDRGTSSEVVTKVGRKYGYFGDGSRTFVETFRLDTGASFHGNEDYNARANGRGFDVYLTEADYRKEQHDKAELTRLQSRLTIGQWGAFLKPLTPEVVAQIHDVLDNAALPGTATQYSSKVRAVCKHCRKKMFGMWKGI